MIRAYRYPDDIDDAHQWTSDPNNTKSDDWEPFSRETTAAELERLARLPIDITGEWHELSICRRADDRNIGGAFYKIESDAQTECTVGIHLATACQGLGLAREAMRIMIDYLGNRGVTCFNALIDSRNERSIALFTKLGFAEQPELQKTVFTKGEECVELQFQLLTSN